MCRLWRVVASQNKLWKRHIEVLLCDPQLLQDHSNAAEGTLRQQFCTASTTLNETHTDFAFYKLKLRAHCTENVCLQAELQFHVGSLVSVGITTGSGRDALWSIGFTNSFAVRVFFIYNNCKHTSCTRYNNETNKDFINLYILADIMCCCFPSVFASSLGIARAPHQLLASNGCWHTETQMEAICLLLQCH